MAEFALFANLPPADIRRAAAYYTQLARELLARADWLEGQDEQSLRDRARMAERKRQWVTTPLLIDSHMAGGMTYGQAVDAAALETGLEGRTLDQAWRTARKRADRQAKAARDAEIKARARAGETPAAIAAHFRLHPKTVRRALDNPAGDAPRTACAPRRAQAAE